jgi:hypothetical protein
VRRAAWCAIVVMALQENEFFLDVAVSELNASQGHFTVRRFHHDSVALNEGQSMCLELFSQGHVNESSAANDAQSFHVHPLALCLCQPYGCLNSGTLLSLVM